MILIVELAEVGEIDFALLHLSNIPSSVEEEDLRTAWWTEGRCWSSSWSQAS